MVRQTFPLNEPFDGCGMVVSENIGLALILTTLAGLSTGIGSAVAYMIIASIVQDHVVKGIEGRLSN
jgi:hypothetical protein